MKNRILTILLLLFVSEGVVVATAEIEGAFGIKLGDTPSADYQQGGVYTKVGTLFFLEPPVKNEHFNEYAVLVTKATNKIYSIYGEREQTTKECEKELSKVKTSLEKRYGPAVEREKIYSIKQKQREITLTCKVNKIEATKASLQIKYTDHQIYEDNLKKLETNQPDASGL